MTKISSIMAQIRAKRADQLQMTEYVNDNLLADEQPRASVGGSIGHRMGVHMASKARFEGNPTVAVQFENVPYGEAISPMTKFRFDVVVVHPDLWAEITALLREIERG